MEVSEQLARLGGVATRARLLELASRTAVDRALRRDEIVRDGHGRYALPSALAAFRVASALSGVVSLRSAAAYWGWEQKAVPDLPDVTVRRNRNLPRESRRVARVHWADLTDTDVHDGIVTTPARTLGDCLRRLPFDEALSIADSAARHDDVDQPTQVLIVDRLRGPGSGQARLVARLATAEAANPFESVLRAIAHPVPGLMFEPQVPIELPGGTVCPDLTDRRLGIVAEADSFSWHGDRRALRSDCRRYNRLTVAGWLVLRFAWEDVMLHASDVQACLVAARSLVGQRAQRPPRRPKAA